MPLLCTRSTTSRRKCCPASVIPSREWQTSAPVVEASPLGPARARQTSPILVVRRFCSFVREVRLAILQRPVSPCVLASAAVAFRLCQSRTTSHSRCTRTCPCSAQLNGYSWSKADNKRAIFKHDLFRKGVSAAQLCRLPARTCRRRPPHRFAGEPASHLSPPGCKAAWGWGGARTQARRRRHRRRGGPHSARSAR